MIIAIRMISKTLKSNRLKIGSKEESLESSPKIKFCSNNSNFSDYIWVSIKSNLIFWL